MVKKNEIPGCIGSLIAYNGESQRQCIGVSSNTKT